MRAAYALYGLGVLILILGAAYAVNHKFIPRSNTETSITSSSTNIMAGDLTLTSSAFESGGSIPSTFTCDSAPPAGGMNPPLSISGVPDGAKSLALIMVDPDVPKALKSDGVFDHWILFNMPPETREIASGVTVGTPGANSAGDNQYTGPCPPPQYEPSTHRYIFSLYALDSELPLQAGASKTEVEKAIQGHIVAHAELVGRYKRQ